MKDNNGVTFGERGLPLERIDRPMRYDWTRDLLGQIWRTANRNPWEYAEPVLPKVIVKEER
jgi:hypothetical protein